MGDYRFSGTGIFNSGNAYSFDVPNNTTAPVVTYDTTIAALGPSLWWKLADAVGASVTADSSGNGNTGVVNGSPTKVQFGQTGPIPGDKAALFVAGNSNTVTSSYQPTISAITEIVWFHSTTPPGPYPAVISCGGDATAHAGLGIYTVQTTGLPYAQISNGAAITNTSTSEHSAVIDGNWHMIVATWDGSHLICYLDGSAGTPVAFSHTSFTTAYDLTVGQSAIGGGAPYTSATLAQATVFTSALTGTQISSLYALA